jgi:hypothetical protein
LQGLQNVAEAGVGASEATDLASRSPNRPNRAVSSYRLLNEVVGVHNYFICNILLFDINHFLHYF